MCQYTKPQKFKNMLALKDIRGNTTTFMIGIWRFYVKLICSLAFRLP